MIHIENHTEGEEPPNDIMEKIGKYSFYIAFLAIIFNPLTVALVFRIGMAVYLCLIMYPILFIITLALALLARRTDDGKFSIVVSTAMLIISAYFTLNFLFNPPYIP